MNTVLKLQEEKEDHTPLVPHVFQFSADMMHLLTKITADTCSNQIQN